MNKNHWRSLGLLLAFVVGSIFHDQIAAHREWLPYSICLMLFLSFIGIDTQKLQPEKSHLYLLLLLQASWIISWGVPYLLGFPIVAEAFFFCAVAPIATASPVIISILKGRVEYITTAMLLSHMSFILLMLFLFPHIINTEGVPYTDMVIDLLGEFSIIILLPALVVFILRLFLPSCKSWAARCAPYTLIIWCINLTIVAASGTVNIIDMHLSFLDIFPLALGAAIICAICFILGYKLGKPLGLAKEFSQGLGQKNTILTLYIASQPYSHPLAYVAPAFYVIYHNIANAIQIARSSAKEGELETKKSSLSD